MTPNPVDAEVNCNLEVALSEGCGMMMDLVMNDQKSLQSGLFILPFQDRMFTKVNLTNLQTVLVGHRGERGLNWREKGPS